MPSTKSSTRSSASKTKAPAKKKKKASSTLKASAKKKPVQEKIVVTKVKEPEPPMPVPPMPGPESSNTCTTCGHMPMNANALVGVLVAVIAILSMVLIGSTIIIDSQSFVIQAATSGGTVADAVLGK